MILVHWQLNFDPNKVQTQNKLNVVNGIGSISDIFKEIKHIIQNL